MLDHTIDETILFCRIRLQSMPIQNRPEAFIIFANLWSCSLLIDIFDNIYNSVEKLEMLKKSSYNPIYTLLINLAYFRGGRIATRCALYLDPHGFWYPVFLRNS
jgi:hypothetical protein